MLLMFLGLDLGGLALVLGRIPRHPLLWFDVFWTVGVTRLGFRSTASTVVVSYQLRWTLMLPLVMLIKPCVYIPSCLVRVKVYSYQSAQDLSLPNNIRIL